MRKWSIGASPLDAHAAMNVQWTVSGADVGLRLDKFLAAAERLRSRSRAAWALERGKVLLNDAEAGARDAARLLREGDLVRLWLDRPGSARRALDAIDAGEVPVVYEDDALVVLNKPAGLLAVPLDHPEGESSVHDRLADRLRSHGRRQSFVVHRIDRDTSGLIVFARNVRAQKALQAQFKRREAERVYIAVVHGCPDPAAGVWRDRLVWDDAASLQKRASARDERGKDAATVYRVIESFRGASLLELRLQTGRQHQIRAQADLHGHPLVGEARYASAVHPSRAIAFARQALHAHRLTFAHPTDGRLVRLEAPLPADLLALIARLRRGSR
jgi:23S rRNA pseudouridine1911/1915/1917 synthase